MNALLDFFTICGMMFCYWSAMLAISYAQFAGWLRPINPAWCYRLRNRVRAWLEQRAVDSGGYVLIVVVLGLLWLGWVINY